MKLVIVVTWTLPLIVVPAAVRLWITRQWRRWAVFYVVVILTLPVTGMIQFETCPHAQYLQLFGKSFALAGEACGNPRKIEPLWTRK